MPALDRSNNGALALHYAAARGCLDCVKLLIETSELSANTQMDNEVTPVYLAAQEGHLEVLKFLVLEAGGSLYVRAKDGMAPVHAAAQMGCLTCLKWMVQEQGVDPNLRDGDGATPLHFAASRGHIDTVRWLLRHGGRLSLDKYGKSPINDAAENQQIECLNILVQHGTVPDYEEEHVNGKLHGCMCRKGDPQQKCSHSDCVNFSSPRAPFYLHNPGREDYPSHDGLYVNPMTNQNDSSSSVSSGSSESFFLHNPQEVVYNRVKDLFEGTRNDATPLTGLTVKVEVHSSSSGAGSEENLSSSDMSERSEEQEHDYEDIYHLSEGAAKKGERARLGDSGSHSRSGSISSTNSAGIVVKLTSQQDRPSISSTAESGVSSASPSDLGQHSEEENEKAKISHRHSLPHHNPAFSRQLKRVVSEPGGPCSPPPPPPPLPPLATVPETPKAPPPVPAAPAGDRTKAGDRALRSGKPIGTRQNGEGNDEAAESENTSSGPGLVNKKLVLPFIPPTFSANGEDCLIKPSEYLKSIGGSRSVSGSNSFLHKTYMKCQEHKSDKSDGGKGNEANGTTQSQSQSQQQQQQPQQQQQHPPPPPPPPPPPLPNFQTSKESTTEQGDGGGGGVRAKIQQQPLSAISIHDLNSVQLRRTAVQKTMSTPAKPLQSASSAEPFQAQKQDLIAELKLSKDIEGVKKMKVERLKTEEKQEKELVSEIAKQLTANTLLEKIPEKDSTGNPIPPWKRQMMAKKAAEKARKDLEEQMKKEAEEKRIQAIPVWKRQLLAKKEESESKPTIYTPKLVEEKKLPQVMLKINEMIQTVTVPSIEITFTEENNKENSRPQANGKAGTEGSGEHQGRGGGGGDEDQEKIEGNEDVNDDDDATQIIPWRAQLRKTNSKLSLID